MSSHAEVVASLVSEYSGHEKKVAELQEAYEHRICMYEIQLSCEEKLVDAFRYGVGSTADMSS